jgi:hypothetical protein
MLSARMKSNRKSDSKIEKCEIGYEKQKHVSSGMA